MGVIYKLKDEVVHFIISQRQSNPLSSCRQLAESASQKFGLHLSKSSVHDVLKESGIVTPRGRKPKEKFEIPHEKKKQIQVSLSQVKLLPLPIEPEVKLLPDPVEVKQESVIASEAKVLMSDTRNSSQSFQEIAASPTAPRNDTSQILPTKDIMETSPEYEEAGKIFFKAALWDLGIYSEGDIKTTDWEYYLTYSKGVNVVLENGKSFFIELQVPLERCILEVADGLVNNIKPFIVHKVSDEDLLKASMDAQAGFKIDTISIVDQKDHVLLDFNNIMEFKRDYIADNRIFVENKDRNILARSKSLFFTQVIDINEFIDKVLNVRGFDTTNEEENIVNLLVNDDDTNKIMLQEASERLNKMFLRDEQGRLVRVIARSVATKQSF